MEFKTWLGLVHIVRAQKKHIFNTPSPCLYCVHMQDLNSTPSLHMYYRYMDRPLAITVCVKLRWSDCNLESITHCAWRSLSSRALRLESSCFTSSVSPNWTLSWHISSLGRVILFSSRVCATFVTLLLYRMHVSSLLISASTSAISSSVWKTWR